MNDRASTIPHEGWVAPHPVTGEPTHVVNRGWLDALTARCDAAEDALKLLEERRRREVQAVAARCVALEKERDAERARAINAETLLIRERRGQRTQA
jgi:acyl-CoA reductase-like NAD-dependent aldehyde dehydrogenase